MPTHNWDKVRLSYGLGLSRPAGSKRESSHVKLLYWPCYILQPTISAISIALSNPDLPIRLDIHTLAGIPFHSIPVSTLSPLLSLVY